MLYIEMTPTRAQTDFLFYTIHDGQIGIQTRMENETVWLSFKQMAELFQINKSGISRHLKDIFETGELVSEATVAKLATVQQEGVRNVTRHLDYYNLDVIISVGYWVNSIRGRWIRTLLPLNRNS